MQKEPWVLLDDNEYDSVWDKVNTLLGFNPSYKTKFPFSIAMEYEVYDLSHANCDNEKFESLMRYIIKTCAANEEYIYALDWQHDGFRYNPNSAELPKMLTSINSDDYGSVNVYFPTFYPNGDYHFFIQKDFVWGCMGHPWEMKYWIFGKQLIEEMKSCSIQLKSEGCIKLNPSK